MRIYSNVNEAMSEIKRDLAEMGTEVRTTTYQNKDVSNNPDFFTKEVQNYMYMIKDVKTIESLSNEWAEAEFKERICPTYVNPGKAWELRREVWEEFIDPRSDKFSYTYNNRLLASRQLNRVIELLLEEPYTRQAYISIWQPIDINRTHGISRVPCSLGYQLQVRNGLLNITYVQRSSDLYTHFENDVFLAYKLLEHISKAISIPMGTLTHIVFSLHGFQKDMKEVF